MMRFVWLSTSSRSTAMTGPDEDEEDIDESVAEEGYWVSSLSDEFDLLDPISSMDAAADMQEVLPRRSLQAGL
jgi:hypothetical protein